MKLIALPLVALLMAANPGALPQAVMAPSASLPQPALFVYDGGAGSTPPVATQGIYAPSFFNSAGTLPAVSGYDGGIVPGNLAVEYGQVITAGGAVNVNLQHLYAATSPGLCICSAEIVNGPTQGSLSNCTLTSDGGQAQLAITSDGGLFGYICIGQ